MQSVSRPSDDTDQSANDSYVVECQIQDEEPQEMELL